jgi:large subunit ribosomal protein L23
MNAREIIRRPLVTEKSMAGLRDGRYTFEVDPRANKVEIRRAVEEIWSVRVTRVNTMLCHGKSRRVGRSVGRRPDWKKAVVTLHEGDRIEFFEGLL